MDESTDEDADESESGSNNGRGLRDQIIGLHSPFGLIGQLKEKRGYSHSQIMWGQPWLMYVLELADQPRRGKKKDVKIFDNADNLRDYLGTCTNRYNNASECE